MLLWEEARRQDITAEKRSKLVTAIMGKIQGRVAELAGSHSASRVIQTCAKHGTPAGVAAADGEGWGCPAVQAPAGASLHGRPGPGVEQLAAGSAQIHADLNVSARMCLTRMRQLILRRAGGHPEGAGAQAAGAEQEPVSFVRCPAARRND